MRNNSKRRAPAPRITRQVGPEVSVPVRCRACVLGVLSFRAIKGSHSVRCVHCRKVTRVIVSCQGERWFVRTARPRAAAI